MKKLIKNISKDKSLRVEKIIWYLLLNISIVSLLLILPTYIHGGHEMREPEWKELIITPFYFTIQSNFLAFLISFLVSFDFIKNTRKLKTLSIYMATNLVITFLVYWIILFPNNPRTKLFDWMRNLTLHTLTPMLAVTVFIFKYFVNNNENEKRRIWKNALHHMVYPLIWLIMAIALYFILGANSKDAIYPFLDLKNNFIIFLIAFFCLSLVYYLLTVFFIYLSNPKKKIKN